MNICDLIHKSNVAKTDIKKLIYRTYYTNRKENYGNICQHGDSISIDNVGVGEAESISPEKNRFSGCSGGAKKLAEIHTHPGRNLFMSEGDILDSFRRNIKTVCIAVESEFKEDRIRCYTLKETHKNKRDYVDNLKKEIEDIVPKIREASNQAFKTKDDKLRNDAYNLEKALRKKYWSEVDELHNLMDDALNWFDYCDSFL